jgi:hypothetical protein
MCAPYLAEALAQRGRQHLRRWVEGVWLMLGGPRCLESAAQLSDVEAFFALMDELVAAGRLTPDNLQAQAATLYAPPDPLAGIGLQMMTIHKSKGLEFDTVIVPGLHRDTGGNESSLLRWDQVVLADGREHLLVAPIKRALPAMLRRPPMIICVASKMGAARTRMSACFTWRLHGRCATCIWSASHWPMRPRMMA